MFRKKRGQEGGGSAAVLVVVITILIVVYIMFIPPEDRQRILEGDSSSSSNSVSTDSEDYIQTNLLSEIPGKLTYLQQKEVEHDLASVYLYTKTEGTVLKEKNSIYVKRAVFSDEKDNFSFTLKDIENSANLLLNFEIISSAGMLNIKINGNEIFNKELSEGQISPIKISKDFLKNQNLIEFSASSVGAAFWKTHEFSLENVQITGDLTDVSARSSKLRFIVDEFEKDNLNRIKLRYFPDCTPGDVGVLRVNLNDCKVFAGVPDCNQLSIHEILPYCIAQGENILEISADKGSYLLDQVQVKSDLKESRDFIYDFYLNSTQYSELQRNNAYVNLTMRFADDIEEKEARIIINGHETVLDTTDVGYSDKIKIFVDQGTNIVKILPRNDFYVGEFNIDYYEKD